MSRRRVSVVLVLLAAIGVLVAVVVSSGSPSTPKNADSAVPSGATAVQRRNLVLTDTESGTLSYAGSQTVYDRLSGTITWLPSVGRVIKPGGTLFKVDGKPVILMDGSTPAYRDLNSSASAGQDILELNRNLVALGFNPDGIVVDDQWQWATTAGIDALQASLGEAQTGSLPLGHIVFLPGDQLVSSVQATLGGTGVSSSASNPSSTNARIVDPSPTPEFVDLTTTAPTTPTTTTSTMTSPTTTPSGTTTHKPTHNPIAQLQREIANLEAEIAKLTAGKGSPGSAKPASTSPAASSSPKRTTTSPSSTTPTSSSSPSSGSASASPVLKTTSTKPVVTVDLNASKQSEAKIGEKVTVTLPDGKTVHGRITAVSPVAQAATGSTSTTTSAGATIPVTITLAGHHTGAGLDQATVSVNFQQQEAKHVLSVPVTALLAQAGGNYAVQEATAPHTLIPVTTGLFAAGYVQISGPGLHAGLQVTDSQG